MSIEDIFNTINDDYGEPDFNKFDDTTDGMRKFSSRMNIWQLVEWFKPIYDLKTYNAMFNEICHRRQQELCVMSKSLYQYSNKDVTQEAENLINEYN